MTLEVKGCISAFKCIYVDTCSRGVHTGNRSVNLRSNLELRLMQVERHVAVLISFLSQPHLICDTCPSNVSEL